MVAAARSIETHRPDRLALDVYAEHFVRASAACAHWPLRIEDAQGGDENPLWGGLGRYFGLRTRVYDDYLLRSADAGVRQFVLLGAGLDTRALRLGWPSGCDVFEVDRPGVLAFKHTVVDGLGARPTAALTSVGVDLCDDWAGALVDAGFDPSVPTAWLAEGVLLYLSSAAERRLVSAVHRLSTPGSTLAYEVKMDRESARGSAVYAATRREMGIDLFGLIDGEPRPDSIADLIALGWSATSHLPSGFSARYGRRPDAVPLDAVASNRWVFATAPAR
jgi:methyltransferase (TIGR00027 family)